MTDLKDLDDRHRLDDSPGPDGRAGQGERGAGPEERWAGLEERLAGLDDRWPVRADAGPVVVASPATVPAVRARLAGLAWPDPDTGRGPADSRTGRGGTGGPVVVVLLRGPSIGAVDRRLGDLLARVYGELHLLVSGPGSVAGAARLRWLVPDLADRTVRVLLPPTERREGVRLVRAAGARHPVVVGTRPHPAGAPTGPRDRVGRARWATDPVQW